MCAEKEFTPITIRDLSTACEILESGVHYFKLIHEIAFATAPGVMCVMHSTFFREHTQLQ
jgi:hypothetical protein